MTFRFKEVSKCAVVPFRQLAGAVLALTTRYSSRPIFALFVKINLLQPVSTRPGVIQSRETEGAPCFMMPTQVSTVSAAIDSRIPAGLLAVLLSARQRSKHAIKR